MVMDDVMMAFSTFSATPTNPVHTTASYSSYTYHMRSNGKDDINSKMPLPPPPMHQRAKPIVITFAVEMGSVDACPSPSKHLQTDLLALSMVMEDKPHAGTGGDFIDL